MNISELALILQSLAAAAIWFFLWFQVWPKARLDNFRQQMFGIRDELFLYAANGTIGFEDPAYRLLRQLMNAYIRYGHRIGPIKLGLTFFEWQISGHTPPLSWEARWQTALKGVADDRVKAELQEFHFRATTAVLEHLVSTSILLALGVVSTALAIVVSQGVRSFRQGLRKAADAVVSTFIDPRLIEEDAVRMAA